MVVYRFPLSFRIVEDGLAYRDIFIKNKTVYQWTAIFGQAHANTYVAVPYALATNGVWINA
ncbi:hypothetical protein DEA98_26715 [Brucella pseudogrignonensis]|uniref:Transposase domain protein n=1 Tax=Brucella pseudogrignonensis TaxID=419475 RepID=A0A256G9U7_9HYPH|nr:hypothetical protein [Brucella pseudogrignonensis]OYR23730.1 transposase domain protein [Brucella pseudogrignonensis]